MPPCGASDVEELVHALCTTSPASTEAVLEQVIAWADKLATADDTPPVEEPPAAEEAPPSSADPVVGPREAVYCVTRGPKSKHELLGIWIGLWDQLRDRLEFKDLFGSGFHVKRCCDIEDARAYWTRERRSEAPQVRKLHDVVCSSS